MEYKLRISGIVEESIVDGPGLRYTLFTQGCPHKCQGCHNPETHSRDGGKMVSIKEVFADFTENPLLAGITFSGGEPFLQAEPLYHLAKMVKENHKSVVVYTGYTLERLEAIAESEPWVSSLLSVTDILVDGPYIEELRDLELLFRGSSNQRIIELKNKDC